MDETPSSLNRALTRAGVPPWARRIAVWLLSVGGISGIVAGLVALAPHLGDWLKYLGEHPLQAVCLVALGGILMTVAGLVVAVTLVFRRLDALHTERLEDAVAREQRGAEREVARARADERLADVLDRMEETLTSHGRLITDLINALRQHMDEHHPDDVQPPAVALTGASSRSDRRNVALEPHSPSPFPSVDRHAATVRMVADHG